MSSVKEVCNALSPHRKVLLLTSVVGDNQAVLNAEGYAECEASRPVWAKCPQK